MTLLTDIIRLLLTMVPQQRERTLREEGEIYAVNGPGLVDDEINAAGLRDIPV